MSRRLLTLSLVATVFVLNLPVAASAASSSDRVFRAPYSGDFAGAGCTGCEAVWWDVDYGASRTNGSVLAYSTISSEVLETDGNGRARAVAQIEQSFTQTKAVYSVVATIDFVLNAAVSRYGSASGAEVFVDASIWNAGCGCEGSSWSRVLSTAYGPQTFSGARLTKVWLVAPSGKQIKGTTFIRATVRSDASVTPISLLLATQDRGATASASGMVNSITYHVNY